MIERLFNEERPRSCLGRSEVAQRKEQLWHCLDSSGQTLLEELLDAHIRQTNVEIQDAFADGFCAAVELMLDCMKHRKDN